jgi:hypothetical protein
MAKDSVDAAVLKRIERVLNGSSRTVVEYFLRYSKLPAGTGDTKSEIDKRVIRYLKEGKFEPEALARDIVGLREYSNKSVFLYSVPKAKLDNVVRRLPNKVKSWSETEIAFEPENPTVSYSIVEGELAHVSFAETHAKPRFNYEAGTIRRIPVTKVVVLDIELDTGFVTLRYDPPEQLGPHGADRFGYYKAYRDRAEEILKTPLHEFSIERAMAKLDGSDLVSVPHGKVLTDDGHIALTTGSDYRTMAVYGSILPEIAAREFGRYIWLENAAGGALLRDVPTELNSRIAMVRFTNDVVPAEVAYVLGQIRALA